MIISRLNFNTIRYVKGKNAARSLDYVGAGEMKEKDTFSFTSRDEQPDTYPNENSQKVGFGSGRVENIERYFGLVGF